MLTEEVLEEVEEVELPENTAEDSGNTGLCIELTQCILTDNSICKEFVLFLEFYDSFFCSCSKVSGNISSIELKLF